LVNGLGNLVSRTLKMMGSLGEVQKPEDALLARFPIRKNLAFLAQNNEALTFEEATPMYLVDNVVWPRYKKLMERFELSSALQAVWAYFDISHLIEWQSNWRESLRGVLT
jgi:hypothetical protein